MVLTGIIWSALVLTTQIQIWELGTLLSREFCKKNSDVFVTGCSCHLAHLAAGAGGQTYQGVTDFDMEDHQVDMYYFFKNSTQRKGIRLECLQFMGQEWEHMSGFVQTQWLSWENCCNKEFKKFPSLKSMFQSRTDNSLGIDRGKIATKGKNKN